MHSDLRVIVEALCAHPISRVFLNPMSESPYTSSDYFRRIPHPMDLSQIRRSLDHASYTQAKLERDIGLICSNAIRYFGPHGQFAQCAHALSRIFAKLTARHRPTTQQWGTAVVRLHRKIEKLLKRPADGGLIEIDLRPEAAPGGLAEADFRNFEAAAELLKDPRDCASMMEIIERHERRRFPPGQSLTLNLAELNPLTARALIAYAKSAFVERGFQYPD
jgi:hypothetical protein